MKIKILCLLVASSTVSPLFSMEKVKTALGRRDERPAEDPRVKLEREQQEVIKKRYDHARKQRDRMKDTDDDYKPIYKSQSYTSIEIPDELDQPVQKGWWECLPANLREQLETIRNNQRYGVKDVCEEIILVVPEGEDSAVFTQTIAWRLERPSLVIDSGIWGEGIDTFKLIESDLWVVQVRDDMSYLYPANLSQLLRKCGNMRNVILVGALAPSVKIPSALARCRGNFFFLKKPSLKQREAYLANRLGCRGIESIVKLAARRLKGLTYTQLDNAVDRIKLLAACRANVGHTYAYSHLTALDEQDIDQAVVALAQEARLLKFKDATESDDNDGNDATPGAYSSTTATNADATPGE